MTVTGSNEFETLLDYLKRSRGFDFTSYKRSTLQRRVEKRMMMVKSESFPDYIDYLEVQPDEFSHLFNTILINVTGFFRDPQVWEYVSAEIIPKLIANKGENEPLRIWSAGCSSGEEAYTLAMVMAEALGTEQFQHRVKVYATDADEEELIKVRTAIYTEKQIADVPPEFQKKYFEKTGDRYTFNREVRRAVIFGRNDLMQNAPISRIDLLACRNTLMYFNTDAQAKILARFHFALNDGGYLVLGKAEMLLTHQHTFMPVDLKRRVFAKVFKRTARERLAVMQLAGNGEGGNGEETAVVSADAATARLRDLGFELDGTAQILVDRAGTLVAANERARSMFGLTTKDLGKELTSLESAYRPVELRTWIEQAYSERRPIILRDIEWAVGARGDGGGSIAPTNGGDGEGLTSRQFFDVLITPMFEPGGILGIKISFANVTRARALQSELQQSKHELETAYEELQTTNEELQSTVEEMETTNEELQSTNEEMETMNEELQSTNEELQTINAELSDRTTELNTLNVFLETILGGLNSGVAVLDGNMIVKAWNVKAEDMWGVRPDEAVGKHLLGLDIGLPVDKLKGCIRSVLTGEVPEHHTTLQATNRRGKLFECKVTCTPLRASAEATGAAGIRGVILLMEE